MTIVRRILSASILTHISGIYLIGLSVIALAIPFFPQFDPNFFDPNTLGDPAPPSWLHWFGTDDLNRDLLIRSIYGARISLTVGIVAVGISTFVGIVYGLVSGYIGGRTDAFLMRLIDLFMAIPSIFLILTIQIILTPTIYNVMIVIGLTSWMGVARLVRAEVLSIKEQMFVTAARGRGLSNFRLLFKHILPHTVHPVIVAATLGIGGAILTESVLSFLGLGVQPPHASWGNMLENSLAYMSDAPWMTLIPGLLITLTVLAFNFLGDGIRIALDPKDADDVRVN
tara:strand:+ start:1159 stop:2010 length:852 start_codon:yes stop_codon:yes gene_type:complete